MEPTNQKPIKAIKLLTRPNKLPKCEESKCEESKCEEPRQVLRATYWTPESHFIVPKGFDLNNKEQVKEYWVRYGTLYIRLTNEKVLKVESLHGMEDPVYKYPEETEITDSDELDWFDPEEYEDNYEECESED